MIFDIGRQLSEFHKYGQLLEKLFRKNCYLAACPPMRSTGDSIFRTFSLIGQMVVFIGSTDPSFEPLE